MTTLTIDMGFSKESLEKIPRGEIEEVRIGPNSTVRDFGFLREFSNIRTIKMQSKMILDFSFVNSLGKLQEILGLPCKISGLIDCPSLEVLCADYSRKLRLSENCRALREVSVSYCSSPETFFGDLKNLAALNSLFVYGGSVQDLRCMDGLRLEELTLCAMRTLRSLDGIGNLSGTLRSLRIESTRNIDGWTDLSRLDGLESLVIAKSGEIRDLSFLNRMTSLRSLRILDTKISDKNITQIEKIPEVDLYGTGID